MNISHDFSQITNKNSNQIASMLIDRLMDFYKVANLVELSAKLDVSQPALSQWKSRNSINSVKRKCRELGIYNEIFTKDVLNVINSLSLKEDDDGNEKIKNEIINKYFNEKDLNEFLETGKIEKQELIKDLTNQEISDLNKVIIEKRNENILEQIKSLGNQLVLEKGEDFLSKLVKQFENSTEEFIINKQNEKEKEIKSKKDR